LVLLFEPLNICLFIRHNVQLILLKSNGTNYTVATHLLPR